MKRHLKRTVAWLLTLAMVLTLLPVTAWATEEGESAAFMAGAPEDGSCGVIYSCGEGYSYVMGYDLVSGNAPACAAELSSDGSAIRSLPDGTAIVKFLKNADGTYYFLLGSKYLVLKDLGTTNSEKEKLVLSDTAESGAKWTILADQAGMAGAYNIKNAEYKWNGTQDVYLEQYNGQKFCGYSYSSSGAKHFQFKFASTSEDTDGRVGEIAAAAALPETGDTVVIYNAYAKAVFGQPAVGAAKPNLSGAAAELKNGTLSYDDIGDGGLIFEVTVSGSEYTFKTGSKYLGMTENYTDESGKVVNDESLILVDEESGYTRWTVSQINGGWLMKNKTASWKGNPVYIEYFDDLFCGYSYDSSRPQIFAMNFYKVTDKYGCGYVVNPAIVFAEGLYAAIGTDSEIKYSVDDLNELTSTEAQYWFDGDETGAKTAEVAYENKVGSFTVPKTELVGHSALNVKVTLTDSMGLSFFKALTLAIEDEPQILDVSPAPNAATGADNLRPEITVNVTNVGEGASFELKLDDQAVAFTNDVALGAESGLWEGTLSYTPAEDLAEGKHTLYASVTRADGKQVGKNWSFFVGESGETLYYGQIHAHTAEYSDGAGTLEQAYEHAHEVDDLDYIIITDHSNYFDTTATATATSYYDLSSLTKTAAGTMTKWEEARQTAKYYDELYDDFVCAYGYEMTWSGGPGHTNSFNTFGVVSRNNAQLNSKTNHAGMFLYNDLMVNAERGLDAEGNELGVDKTKYITDAPVVSQFNHPGTTFGNFGNFAGYTASRDDVLNLVEVGNGEGKVGGSGYFPSYEQYDLALSMGWHIGPTNNQDNHKGKWGDSNTCRDVVLTDDFTEAGIYRALDQRRIYSTEDQNLEIYYTLNAAGVDYKLGDIAPIDKDNQPETVTAKLTVNEPDRENIQKLQIIGEGASVLKEVSVGATSYRGEITIPNNSGYYYIKVIEADGDIAVTAPVWTSETVPVAVELSTDSAVAAQGVEENILANLVNGSESESVTLDGYRIIAEGSVVAESNEPETVAPGGAKKLVVPFTPATTDPSEKKTYDITAEFTFTYKGTQSTYTKTISETSYPPELMTYVGLDRGHTNFYVSGDYANNETSFIQICADNGIIVEYINAGEMTAEKLAKYKMVVLTVPRVNETTAPTVWTEDEIAAIAQYAQNGGNLINLSKSDRYDYGTGEYASATMSNLINEAVGSNVRFAKGIVVDNEKKSNEAYRINFEGAERLGEHLFTRGISLSTNGQYQYYNGTGLVTLEGKEDQVTGLVKPYDSTWIASYKANFTGSAYVPNYESDVVVAPKGSFNLITAEQLPGGGFLVCGGACFISNYDLKTGMSISEQYVNYGLVMNILRFIRDGEDNTVITPITEVHAAGDAGGAPVTEENTASGTEYTVEGIITSNASDYDKDTAFFDCIYVQDETRGINVFPVSGYYFIGEKVRVHGAITYYNGEIELNLSPEYNGSIEIVSNYVTPLEPTDVSCAEAMDDANIGNLVRVSGTISDIHRTEGVVDYVYVTDETGTATLFINNYIQKNYTGLDELKVGDNVVGTGIGSRDADENDLSGSTFIRRLRVRSRYEIYDPAHPPVMLDKTALEEAIAAAEALNESDYTEESWAVLAAALLEAKTALENAGSQEALDAAAEALNNAIAALEPKPVEPPAEGEYVLTTALSEGDEVVVYHPTSGKAMGKELSGNKIAAVDATVADGRLTVADGMGLYTVEYADETNFLLKSQDGKYLTSGATGNSMSLEDTANEYSQWYLAVLDETAGKVAVRSTNAAYNGNKNQALEYYNGFTTYGWRDNNDAFIFRLYIKPAPTTFNLSTALGEGDEVIVYHPTSSNAMGKELSGNKIAASSAVTVENDVLTPAEDGTTGIYTVEYADEVNFLLKSQDGKYLTSGATGNSMSLEDTANEYSQWYLAVLDEAAGKVAVRSTNAAYNGNKNQALEYYNGFTTYGWRDNNDAFIFRLYVKGAGAAPQPGLNKTALQNAIAAAEALTEADYTAESWAALQEALAAARTALETAETQEALDAAAEALNAAIAALVPVAQPAEGDYALTTALSEGDEVVVYHPTSGKAMGKALSGNKIAAADATVANGRLTPSEDAGLYTVEYVDETNFLLKSQDGKYLTSGATGNSMSLEDTANEYSQWYLQVLDETAGKVAVRSTNAAYNGNKNQALEYYNGFTTYGWRDNNDAFIFQLYVKAAAEAFVLNTEIAEGSELIVYHPTSALAMGKELSGSKIAASSPVTVENDVLTPAEDGTTGIYTVEFADETNFLLKSQDGKYLTSGATGNSMSLEDTANEYSQWYIAVLDEAAGKVAVRSTNAAYNGNKNQALEYYSGFTTYGWRDNNDAFIFRLYVKGAAPAGLLTQTLQRLIAEAEALNEADYTAESWAQLQVVLAAAKDALETATEQAAIDRAANALRNAIDALVKAPTGTEWVATPFNEITPEDRVVPVFNLSNGKSYGVTNNNGTDYPPAAVELTVSTAKAESKLAEDPAPEIVWNVIANEDSTFIVRPDGDDTKNLYCLTSSNNGIRVGTNTDDNVFEIDPESGYIVHRYTTDNGAATRYLGIYNEQNLRSYTSINNNIKNQSVTFYVEKEKEQVNTEFEFLVTSDLHGQIFATDYTQPYANSGTYSRGLTRVSTYIKEQKAAYGDNLYVVDMGDTFQGAPLTYYYAFNKPEVDDPAIKAFRSIGYDMWVVGNHEFNYGLPILTRQMDYAVSASTETEKQLTISMANYLKAETNSDESKDWSTWRDVAPYVVKDFGGYKVAIIGFGNPNIPQWDVPTNWEGIYFADIIETYKHYEAEMLAKADMIVVVAHSGVESDPVSDFIRQLLEETDSIAFAFSGHEHRNAITNVTNAAGKTVPILSPYTKARRIAQVKVTVENGEPTITPELKNMENYPLDPELVELLQPYETDTWENYMLQPIGKALGDYPAADLGTKPSAFMDLINEVQTWGAYDRTGENTPDKPEDDTRAMLSISAPLTSGSNANLISEGDIYLGDMFGLYRFENWFFQITMSGEEVRQWLEFAATKIRVDEAGQPYVTSGDLTYYDVIYGEGFHYEIDVSKPEGERVFNMTYNGEPVAADQQFTVVVNNYRYNGGGNYVSWLNEHGCEFIANDPDRIIYSTQFDMIQGEDEGQARTLLIRYIEQQTAENGGITPAISSDWIVWNGVPELDKTALEEAIAAAEAIDRSKYTEESLANLDAILAAAQDALANATEQAALDQAAVALNNAMDALVRKPVESPKDDYFADGDMNEGQWTILNEQKDRPDPDDAWSYYRFDQGTGLVMPTQHNSIYQTATPGAWKNMFTMPADGDWDVVAKAFYPLQTTGNYQQVQFIAWQDEDNYVRINCQNNLRVEPFYEQNGVAVNQNGHVSTATGNADGSATFYFRIRRTGNTYVLSYSNDNCQTWIDGGTYEAALENVKIALFCTQDYGPNQRRYKEPVELAFEYVAVLSANGETVRSEAEMLTWAAQNAADYMAAALPAETAENLVFLAPHGYTVEFVSDNEAVIDSNGLVTPAATEQQVKVAVKVTEGETTATSEQVTITVPASGVQPVLDKTALEAAVAAAEALNAEDYTDESWAPFAAALEAAQAALETATTQEELDAALAALNEAVEALESKPIAAEGWRLAETFEPGKTYVIVSEAQYAMTNVPVAAPRSYSGADTTLGAEQITVENGVITSEVTDAMMFTFTEVPDFTTVDGEKVYYLNDVNGKFVRRGSMSRSNAALLLEDSVNNTQRYFTFTLKPYEDRENTYALYLNTERSYGTDYAAYIFGGDVNGTLAFDIPDGQAQRSADDPFAFMNNDTCSKITLYELAGVAPTMQDIDFTNPADASKFELVNPTEGTGIEEGVGLALITTKTGVEVAAGQNSGDAAITPEDLVKVPVFGDWKATLKVEFDTNGARNGYYQFFAFFAAANDEYGTTDLAGIRGGDGAMQDFLRKDGEVTADTDGVKSAPGFDTAGKTYYLRLEKTGTTYVASRSDDGVTFTEMFTLADTGIEAQYIFLDAYTGMTTGYKFTLKSLTYGDSGEPVKPDLTALEAAIAAAGELVEDEYTEESWAALETALAAAEAAKTAETQAEVDAATEALNAAIEALEKKPIEPPKPDLTALEAAIAAAEALNKDEYTEESWAALETALAAAEAAKTAETQAEVDAAKDDLLDAIEKLEKKPDTQKPDLTALEAAIAAAEALNKDEYTEESWAALETALAAAEAAKTAETQAEVDAAKDDLLEAIEKLEKAETPPPPFQFDDVTNPDKFYYDSVYWAYNHEPQITKGTSDTLFSPDEPCTRGQVVTFLYRAAGEPEITGGNNPFTDVAEGKFYYKAVLWAVEKGITNGITSTTFEPNTVCNRGQIVTFLWRFAGEKAPEKTDNPFTDVAEGKFYYNAVLWAVEAGVTKGVTETTFEPDTVCTRGQVVTFLFRATAE